MRSSSAGSSSRRARAAIFSTVPASIGMGELREGGEDLLHPRAPELDGQLGPLPHPFASDHDPLPELGMNDPKPHGALQRALGGARDRPAPPAGRVAGRLDVPVPL